jgi:hypothetical protein
VTAPWHARSRAEHDRVEELVLGRWLPAATTFSAYWADRAAQLGRAPDTLVSRADLRAFAPVREGDVREVGGPGAPALLMRPTQDQIKARASSGVLLSVAGSIRRQGADGERRVILEEYKPIHIHRGGADDDLAIAYSRSDLDRLHRCGARAAWLLGLDDADYLVSAVPAGPRLDWWGVYHLALGASILALHPRGATDDLERVLASFALVPATVVAVAVDEAIELAALMVERGVEAPRVHTVLTVGAPPDDATRAAIADAWQAAGASANTLVVRTLFAPPEARALWTEPRAEPTGLVTYPDLEILEVVDPLTGEPTDGAGDLTITTAGWNGAALVRFQTGVYVDGLTTEPCPASGVTAPRIVGEVAPLAWQTAVEVAPGTHRHFDFRSAGLVVGTVPGVASWRMELRGPTTRIRHDRLHVELAGDVDDRAVTEMSDRLAAVAGCAPTDVKVVPDPVLIDRQVDEDGSPFVDSR